MVEQCMAAVRSRQELCPDVFLLWLDAPGIAAAARPGQFVAIRCADRMLRRPFSIHRVGSSSSSSARESGGGVAIVFRAVGAGSRWLSQQSVGERLDILGPLGNGFSIERGARRLLLVAGGIGIAPLLFLALEAAKNHEVTLVHGARAAAGLYPLPEMPMNVTLVTLTEDGSVGEKGTVVDVLPRLLDTADQVVACGPVGMYRTMASDCLSLPEATAAKLRRCQVSVEVRMGCGIGACYACTIATRQGPKKVCLDGPVFALGEVEWDSVRV
jgi:dihydroorotate dehydrogenase electron transfer subunit